MRIMNRPFDEGQFDFLKMWEFLIQDYTDKKEQYLWSIDRLADWKYGLWHVKKFFPSFMRKNAQLWINNLEQLVGFVISENGDHQFSVLAKRGYELLYPEMLQWVKSNWCGRGGSLSTEVHEYQDAYKLVLAKEGFQQGSPAVVSRQYDLCMKAAEPIALDPEFSIRDMTEIGDYTGKVLLGIDAWSNGSRPCEISELDVLQYEYVRENPNYDPRFDLSVVDRSGQHLSSCSAYIDYVNNVAVIEKVCTHSEYRRRGLAEAVIRECFRRLHAEGIEYAYIGGYSVEAKSLYSKLGASETVNWFHYTWSKD